MSSTTDKSNIKLIFSQNIRTLMSEQNISRRDLCNVLNLKYTTLCDWVNGRTLPRGDQLEKLSDYFNIDAGNLFIEIDKGKTVNRQKSLNNYSAYVRRLDMNILNHLTDEQINDMISSGYYFEHRKLEDYIIESGNSLVVSDEIDWGESAGNEIW